MKTGVIMEINGRFLTLLTPDGEFLQARKLDGHYQIGQEIDFFPVEQKKIEKQSILSIFQGFKTKLVFAAALIFVLVTASVIPFNGNDEVYAYMSIDINPSMELALNDEYQVIDIYPYNEEAKQIVNEIKDWKKKDVHTITNKIIQEIENQGFTKTNHEIVIATVFVEDKKGENDERLEQEISQIQKNINKESIELQVVQGTKEDREAAKEKGITTGALKKKQLEIKQAEEKKQKGQKKGQSIEQGKTNTPQEKQKQKANEHSEQKGNGKQNPGKENKPKLDEKQIPPGQEKKKSSAESQTPPGQEKDLNQTEKKIPPGQLKKQQENHPSVKEGKKEKQASSDQEKNEKRTSPGKENQKEIE